MTPHCKIMGILNVTPDSFSDGGQFESLENAVDHALAMQVEGADLIDIGGESTRPGAEPVSTATEIARVVPVIEAVRSQTDIPISIDTTKAEVAAAALAAGANWINDVSAATRDPAMPALMASAQVPVVLMHSRGTSETMQQMTDYNDLIRELSTYLLEQAHKLKQLGVKEIILDPGLGFAKTAKQNLYLLHHLPALQKLGYPLLIGGSRKSFIQRLLGNKPNEILEGSLAIAAQAINTGCNYIRVHDVRATAQLRTVLEAIQNPESAYLPK